MSRTPKNLSQTVMKALTVLEFVAEQGREMGVNEVARSLEMDSSTTYRLMATLNARGYLRQDRDTNKYRIGPRVLLLYSAMQDVLELRKLALPHLNRLVEATEETAHLLALQGPDGVYIERVDSPKTVRMVSYVGKQEFLHCSSVGKAILAYLPEDEVDWILQVRGLPPITKNTITDPNALKAELRQVRARGYALDDMEGEESVRCVGAPIFDLTGKPIAAISVAGPAFRTDFDRLESFAPLLIDAAQEISRELGFEEYPSAAIKGG